MRSMLLFYAIHEKNCISMEFHLLLNTRGRFRAIPRHSAAGSRALANARFRQIPEKPSENVQNLQISMLMETRHNEENLLLVFTRQQLNLDFFFVFEDSRNEDVIVFVVANANPAIH